MENQQRRFTKYCRLGAEHCQKFYAAVHGLLPGQCGLFNLQDVLGNKFIFYFSVLTS